MEERKQEDQRYRGRDLMNAQKNMLFNNLMDAIKKEQGELLYLLDCKEKNTEEYRRYKKELEGVHAGEKNPQKEDEIKEKMIIIERAQGDILKMLQPLFREKFDQIAHETPPGIEYNEALKQDIWFDFIFGKRDIPSLGEGSRENYRIEQRYKSTEENYQRRLQKLAEKRKKEKEKILVPLDHHLITEKNYKKYIGRITKHMEKYARKYSKMSPIDIQNIKLTKEIIENHFMYCLINALIDTKCVFDIKSTRGGKCLDLSLDMILVYFNTILQTQLDIRPIDIKRKLWQNTNSGGYPTDISYQKAMIEDIEYREEYLNKTYFSPKGTNIHTTRIEIKNEYDAQKGIGEMCFELINPWYHIYKEHAEKYQKHLNILQEYYDKSIEKDSQVMAIIKDIQEKLSYAQEKKKEHTVFEEDKSNIKPKYDHSLTEIQQKYLKKYQVPAQYRHVFGVIINKMNHYYQIKSIVNKEAEKVNEKSFEELENSPHTFHDFLVYGEKYKTNVHRDAECTKRRRVEWKKRKEKRFPTQTALKF